MKKIFLIASALLLATTAQASYLYWQVTSDDYSASNIFGGDASAVYSAKVTYSDGTAGNEFKPYTTYGTMKEVNYDTSTYDDATAVKVPSGNTYLVEGAFNEGYTYYIELYNSAGTLVSRSAGSTSSQLSDGNYVYASANVASMLNPSSVNVWHGGGAYSAVPEPTSAMLMLFGAAFLGLKRKNRSIA